MRMLLLQVNKLRPVGRSLQQLGDTCLMDVIKSLVLPRNLAEVTLGKERSEVSVLLNQPEEINMALDSLSWNVSF